ncbi:ABC transporter substrate-binding protein [Prochlorococcus sp. MIT 1307]|uniref:ABC transporter substrate-binding protein n=1 Tax=Prochlorococcus sp. MIT 1307 TaxID=3096219 RepID=UPI002A75EFB5|nr:ABC transporter substrate-binding protein [Prochlorococcus sp. MIT 1307]
MPAPFAKSTERLVEQFNKENKGKINLEVTQGPLETESVSDLAISSLLLGNSPFDILLMDVTWLPKYAEAGWLATLDQWIDPNMRDSLSYGASLGNSYKGELYRWPLVADMGLLYWRTDLMKRAPKTPEELLEISLELKNKGIVPYGYVWQGRQYEGLSCVFLEVLSGFKGEWLNNSNEINLANPESIKAASWLNELIQSGASPKSVTNFSETEALQAFESGEAAFMRNWPYAWAELQKEKSSVKDKVGITTMVSENGENSTATLGSWGFSILKSSDNKEAAFEAIKFLTSESAQKELFIHNGYTPTKEHIFEDKELIKNSPILPILKKALAIAKPRPETPLYAQISDVLQKQLSSILTDGKDVNEAMKLAEQKSRKIISSTGS